MRLPIPNIQRQVAPTPANAGPLASGVPAYGTENLGAALFNVGANMQQAANIEADRAAREAERQAKEAADKLARVEHEQRKARVIERSRDDRLKWQELMQQRQTEAPEGADGFTPTVLKDFDAYREEATKTIQDPEERAMYDGYLSALREHVGEKALVFQASSRANFRAKTLTEGVEKSARLVTVDPSQMPDVLAQELALIRSSSDLTAEQRSVLADRAKDTLSWAATQTLVDRNPDAFLERVGVRGGKPGKDGTPPKQDIEKATAAVAGDAVLSQLPPQRLQQAIDRATMLSMSRKAQADAERERRARQAEAAQNKAFREATAAYTIMDGAIAAGRQIDMTNPQNLHLIKQIQQVPEYAAAFKDGLSNLSKNTAVAMQPIPQQQATLNALYAQRNVKGTSPGLEKEIARVEGVIKEARTAYANEPLKAAADYGLIPAVAPLDVSSLDTVTQGLAARSQQAQAAGQQAGRPVSPFTSDEAPKIAQQLLSLPADQQGVRIAQLTSQMTPQQATAFAKQIDPQARALSLAMSAGSSMTTEGRTVSGLILRGQQAIKDKSIKEDAGAEFGVRASLAKEVGDALSGPSRDAVIDAARYIYLGKQAAGERVSYSGAIALAAGGPIVELNGRKIPAPMGVDVEDRLASYPAKAVAAQAPDGNVYVAGQPVPVAAFVASLPDAQLEPLSVGRYMVRSGGNLVSNADRRPIVIELK